jgi:hypothetical protein
MDGYNPPKPVLYFRAEAGREPLFDAADAPLDPTGRTGFASQAHFEMLAKPKGKDGQRKWVRQDYLVIAAGADRYFGPVKVELTPDGKLTGRMVPSTDDTPEKDTYCDDITNFAY